MERIAGSHAPISVSGDESHIWAVKRALASISVDGSEEILEVTEVLRQREFICSGGIEWTGGSQQGLWGRPFPDRNFLSVTKQFAGMSAAMLIEEGKLELSARVSKYLPHLNIPIVGRELLMKDLLSHTSGLPDFLSAGLSSNKAIGEWLAKRQPQWPLGLYQGYANSKYNLLSQVIAAIVGEPFHKFLKRRIYDVLGMKSTWDNCNINGSGRIRTTLADYARWDLALFRQDGRLLSPSDYQMLITSGTFDNGELVPYNFGWNLRPDAENELEVQFHDGGGVVWYNRIWRHIPSNTTVALFAYKNEGFSAPTAANEVLAVCQSLATQSSQSISKRFKFDCEHFLEAEPSECIPAAASTSGYASSSSKNKAPQV